MAYTGSDPTENDSAADLLAELQHKRNRASLSTLMETRAAECLDVLSGRKTKSYVEKENIEALLQTYETLEEIKAELGIESDDNGSYIPESKVLAANEAVLLGWIVANKWGEFGSKKITKKDRLLIEDAPAHVAPTLVSCLDLSLKDEEVVSEWTTAVGRERVEVVKSLRAALTGR